MPYQPLFTLEEPSAKTGFEEWLEKADALCTGSFGLSIHDLPDVDWAGMHADGVGPKAALKVALREAGF